MILDAIGSGQERVTSAIRAASASTGMSFDYLLKTAIRESALDPKAKASTSSARGLFQFIDTTWMQMVKDEGANFGLGHYAKDIERTADGQYVVRDPARRAEILKLRENPEAASYMAGAFASRNSAEIESVLGRKPTSGELYIAHFLGANGAKRFLLANAANPKTNAATLFPEAAAANKSIFYNRTGGAKTTMEVYAGLTGRHDRAPPPPTDVVTAVAAMPPQSASAAKFATVVTPDRAAERQTVAQFDFAESRSYSNFTPENTPAYRSLYQSRHTAGVAAAVQELWSRDTAQKVVEAEASQVMRVAESLQPQPGIATVAKSST
jgi:hypothetical protein